MIKTSRQLSINLLRHDNWQGWQSFQFSLTTTTTTCNTFSGEAVRHSTAVHSKIVRFRTNLIRICTQKCNRTFWQKVWYWTVNRICVSSAALYQFYKNSPKTCYSYRYDTDMWVLIWYCADAPCNWKEIYRGYRLSATCVQHSSVYVHRGLCMARTLTRNVLFKKIKKKKQMFCLKMYIIHT